MLHKRLEKVLEDFVTENGYSYDITELVSILLPFIYDEIERRQAGG